MTRSILAAGLAVFCLLLLAPGCGGGGGGGGGPTTPPPPSQSIVFTPDGSSGSRVVFLDAADTSTPNRLILDVRVDGADAPGVFGVAFDLVFPGGFLNFAAAATMEGDFLSGDGEDTSLTVDESEPGRVLVAVTRLGEVAGGVEGSGLLLTLEFPTTANGNGELSLENASVVDGLGVRRFDFEFVGGSLSVQR